MTTTATHLSPTHATSKALIATQNTRQTSKWTDMDPNTLGSGRTDGQREQLKFKRQTTMPMIRLVLPSFYCSNLPNNKMKKTDGWTDFYNSTKTKNKTPFQFQANSVDFSLWLVYNMKIRSNKIK